MEQKSLIIICTNEKNFSKFNSPWRISQNPHYVWMEFLLSESIKPNFYSINHTEAVLNHKEAEKCKQASKKGKVGCN